MSKVVYKPLCEAIQQGNIPRLRTLAQADTEAACHWKPIMDAAFLGSAPCIDVLVENGANVNVRARTGARHTPLTRLCQHHRTIPKHDGHERALCRLLAHGADVAVPAGPLALTPLCYAAMGPHENLVKRLKKEAQPVDVWSAAALCDLGRLRKLAQQNAIDSRDAEGRTGLHYVAMSGFHRVCGIETAISCLDYLISEGVEVDAAQAIQEGESVFNATALWYAVSWQGNLTMSQRLLMHGANPNPAVYSALFEGNVEICNALDAHGADWNQKFAGQTPLMELIKWNRPKLLPWLLERGVDPGIRNSEGLTALDLARKRKVRNDVIDLLVASMPPSDVDTEESG